MRIDTRQSRSCADCGEPGEWNAQFCTGCGNKLSAQVTRDLEESGIWMRPPATPLRHQVTLLFCDLVGSSELRSDDDPEDLCAVLRVYRAVCAAAIARFGGRIARTFGDRLLVHFDDRQMRADHTDHAQRAVQAGLAIIAAVSDPDGAMRQHGMKCAVRIGIHTDWVAAHSELASAEDPARMAARLQQLAEPNQLVVGPTTFESIEGCFPVMGMGPQAVHGARHPMPVWRVLQKAEPGSYARA
jgi:class 3 adenylate cyclase